MRDNGTILLEILQAKRNLLVTEVIIKSGLGSGTVHTTLNRLEQKGLVETWTIKELSNPRYAKITPNGRLYLKGKLMTEKATEQNGAKA